MRKHRIHLGRRRPDLDLAHTGPSATLDLLQPAEPVAPARVQLRAELFEADRIGPVPALIAAARTRTRPAVRNSQDPRGDTGRHGAGDRPRAGAVRGRCGSDEAAPAESARAAATPDATPEAATADARPARPPRRKGTRIKAIDSQYGTILGDVRGRVPVRQGALEPERVLWRQARRHGCPCSPGSPRGGQGRARAPGRDPRGAALAGARSLATGGRTTTTSDDAPGRVLCHGVLEFGGLWLVLRPDGSPIG
jgi:hypothetical protein